MNNKKGVKRPILFKSKKCTIKVIELGYDPLTGTLIMANDMYVPFRDLNPNHYKKITFKIYE